MIDVNIYWTEKDKRKELAAKHTREMERDYGPQIKDCVSKTSVYKNTPSTSIVKWIVPDMKIEVVDEDSVSAIFNHHEGKTAVLNFASYKNPGGKFIEGSKAQEECLCIESFLYNVLREFDNIYYSKNRRELNKALYLNRALYTPNVKFFRDGKTVDCDVITCAAPNLRAARKYATVSNDENEEALISRIKFVLDIAEHHKVDTLILGAFGCGVFGQDPREVASLFQQHLLYSHSVFRKVIFAVPNGRDNNLMYFKTVFGE